MREEVHGNGGAGGTWIYKQLYGWGTIYPNVWLPSVSELVGIDSNAYADYNNCYFSAMQGMNSSEYWWVDKTGGSQFAYFKKYNASGGPEKLWACGGSHPYWLRSSAMDKPTVVWRTINAKQIGTLAATDSFAVHPAAERKLERLFIIPRKYDIIRKRQ